MLANQSHTLFKGSTIVKETSCNLLYIKEYDFYNPRNIFILQERNISELKEFLELPTIEINQEIKNKYRFSGGWLKEFWE